MTEEVSNISTKALRNSFDLLGYGIGHISDSELKAKTEKVLHRVRESGIDVNREPHKFLEIVLEIFEV